MVANTADDIWVHGLKVCPDLDTVMYTLGDGIDTERGWGRTEETWHAKEELAAYGVEPTWFGLGDRDLATHLVRTQMLEAGYPLSAVTAALCRAGSPGVELLPMTDDRVETHVVIDDPDSGERRAVHFQEYWIRHQAAVPAHAVVPIGLDDAKPGPGVLEAITDADVVLVPPSNPVVSVGTILGVPGIRDALVATTAPVVGVSGIIGERPRARHGPPAARRSSASRCRPPAWPSTTAPGARRGARRLAGRHLRRRPGRRVSEAAGHALPRRTALDDRPRRDRRHGRAPRSSWCDDGTRVPAGGLGRRRHRRGRPRAPTSARCSPRLDLRDGDVVLVTSKVVSKAEGRVVPAIARTPSASETVRVVARRGPTSIVENHLGLVMAAAGVDASNVAPGHVVLLPEDPDAVGAHPAGPACTPRRAATWPWWSPTPPAGPGAPGRPTSRSGRRVWSRWTTFAGRTDSYGNALAVTAPAVADELASVAELVTGKLGGRPLSVVRGMAERVLPPGEHGPGARALVRPARQDMFALGAREAVLAAVRGDRPTASAARRPPTRCSRPSRRAGSRRAPRARRCGCDCPTSCATRWLSWNGCGCSRTRTDGVRRATPAPDSVTVSPARP